MAQPPCALSLSSAVRASTRSVPPLRSKAACRMGSGQGVLVRCSAQTNQNARTGQGKPLKDTFPVMPCPSPSFAQRRSMISGNGLPSAASATITRKSSDRVSVAFNARP